ATTLGVASRRLTIPTVKDGNDSCRTALCCPAASRSGTAVPLQLCRLHHAARHRNCTPQLRAPKPILTLHASQVARRSPRLTAQQARTVQPRGSRGLISLSPTPAIAAVAEAHCGHGPPSNR